jgi:hypothetical protein
MLVDEIQNLSSLCLSWLNEYSNGVYQALRKKTSTIQLADGKEVIIIRNKNNFIKFLLVNSKRFHLTIIFQ